MDPTFPVAHLYFGDALTTMGKYEEAIREWQRGQVLSGESPAQTSAEADALLKALKRGGEKEFWRKNLEITLRNREQALGSGYFPAVSVVFAYARAGDNDTAFEWFEKAYQDREGQALNGFQCWRDLKNLHADPRFVELVRRLGLPE